MLFCCSASQHPDYVTSCFNSGCFVDETLNGMGQRYVGQNPFAGGKRVMLTPEVRSSKKVKVRNQLTARRLTLHNFVLYSL